jgi:hypothetical protein
MQRPGALPRKQSRDLEAAIPKRLVRLSIGEDDHRRALSHAEKMGIVIRSHGISNFSEALLRGRAVCAGVAY